MGAVVGVGCGGGGAMVGVAEPAVGAAAAGHMYDVGSKGIANVKAGV